MTTLAARFLEPEVRPLVVKDCCAILDRQVAEKKGLSGIAIKGAFKAVKAIKPGFVPGVVDALLDEWVEKLSQFEARHASSGAAGTFETYLVEHRKEVSEALIEVTDLRAQTTKHKTAKKFYERLRPSALANVEEAIPELAQLVTKYGTPAQEAAQANA
ncbi:MAG: hypothetical protein KC635_11415 [Myxococcales bacterium]|nr:hypothetical protein [Myxococcales bacterium]MCB9736332.1 hypothetical protein [Deltaproteobacteria bacterium]